MAGKRQAPLPPSPSERGCRNEHHPPPLGSDAPARHAARFRETPLVFPSGSHTLSLIHISEPTRRS
eukprot:6794497-Prymnesium_polylepis.1